MYTRPLTDQGLLTILYSVTGFQSMQFRSSLCQAAPTTCLYVDLPKNEATQIVLTGIEASIFCRIIKRLVGEKMTADEDYKKLIADKTCFDVYRRRRRTACSGNSAPLLCKIHFTTRSRKKYKCELDSVRWFSHRGRSGGRHNCITYLRAPEDRCRKKWFFCTLHIIAKFHHPEFNRSEVIMLTNTGKQNRRHWKHPPRSAMLRRWVKTAVYKPTC